MDNETSDRNRQIYAVVNGRTSHSVIEVPSFTTHRTHERTETIDDPKIRGKIFYNKEPIIMGIYRNTNV